MSFLHRDIQEVMLMWFAFSCWGGEWSNPKEGSLYTNLPTRFPACPAKYAKSPPTYPTPFLQTHLAQTSFTFLFPEGLHFQVKGDRIFGTGDYWEGIFSSTCNLTYSLDGADLMKPENRKNMSSVKDTGVKQKTAFDSSQIFSSLSSRFQCIRINQILRPEF